VRGGQQKAHRDRGAHFGRFAGRIRSSGQGGGKVKPVPVVVSLGCGIDSSTMTVMDANGDPRRQGVEVMASLHSDMGAEMPQTYQFYQDYLFPCLEEQGAPRLQVLMPQVRDRHGKTHSNLYEYYYAQACVPSRSRRSCTDRFKISVVNARIAETCGDDIPVLIGFDCHETRRADGLAQFSDRYRFPLVGAGIDRLEAAAILLRAGLLASAARSLVWPIGGQ